MVTSHVVPSSCKSSSSLLLYQGEAKVSQLPDFQDKSYLAPVGTEKPLSLVTSNWRTRK